MNATDAMTRATADKVNTAISAAGKSTLAVSDETGIPRVTLIRRLDGVVPFNVAELARIAAMLGVTVSALLPEEDAVAAARSQEWSA